MKFIKAFFKHIFNRIWRLLRWIIFASVTGVILGLVAAAFNFCLTEAVTLRETNVGIAIFLPIVGLLIVYLYNKFSNAQDKGTNLVLSSINSDEHIPLRMAPLIFISTVLTQMFGGSAGREGAALQIGGSIGNYLGNWFKLDSKDKKVFIMSGMSAAFSAIFGTPVAAAIFSIEVGSVGIMQYSALVPCTISSLVASSIGKSLGCESPNYLIKGITEFNLLTGGKTILLACLCAGISVIFCIMLHSFGKVFKTFSSNPYERVFFGGTVILCITLILGTTRYSGTGIEVIASAIGGTARNSDFFWKMLFTAITLACGYKGGEIIPSFLVGATFGCVIAPILGLSSSLGAAIGMVSVFCGVTNCPIASLLIALELFGKAPILYFLLAIAISYMLSGYYSLYKTQIIAVSKYKNEYVDKKTH